MSQSGAFQGDLLSGVLFTLTQAGALVHLRAVLERPNHLSAACIPREAEYVDDMNFISEDEDKFKQILPIALATSVLHEWRLKINCRNLSF